jgi:hypothetical protein
MKKLWWFIMNQISTTHRDKQCESADSPSRLAPAALLARPIPPRAARTAALGMDRIGAPSDRHSRASGPRSGTRHGRILALRIGPVSSHAASTRTP